MAVDLRQPLASPPEDVVKHDRYLNLRQRLRKMTEKQRAQRKGESKPRVGPPAVVTYAAAGTHLARDGKPYTITYDKPETT